MARPSRKGNLAEMVIAASERGRAPGLAFTTKAQLVDDWLRRAIIHGDLPPGTRIDQEELALALNVSRMPLRQALSRLEADGFIEVEPHRSAIVAPLRRTELEELYAMRMALEAEVAERAAAQRPGPDVQELRAAVDAQREAVEDGDGERFVTLDRTFHRAIYVAAGWERAFRTIERLRDACDRYVHVYVSGSDNARRSLGEHDAIIAAIEAGDAPLTGELTRAHVRQGRERLIPLIPAETA